MTDEATRVAPAAGDDVLERARQADLEPWALLRAVRDPAGRVVDFVYHDINAAGARRQRTRREDLIGRSVAETLPAVRACGLLEMYAHCVDTGEPLVLDGFATPGGDRRYDVRGARVPPDLLSLTWRDVTERAEQQKATELSEELLRTAADAMLDPMAVVEVVRRPGSATVDLIYRDVNRAFCDYVGLTHDQQVGHSLLETFPGVDGAGLLARYAHCAVTGEPVVLDDFPYFNELLGRTRYYDIHCKRARPGLIVLSFRDTTERREYVRNLAESEERYRLLALNSGDAILHVRDGIVVWASPAIESVWGASPQHWAGTRLRDVVPAGELPAFDRRWATAEAGGTVRERVRMTSVTGGTHWVHLHIRPFYDAEGRRDGTAATLHLVDDEVAAEQELAEARRQKEEAEALYRRSMESAAVAMCLASPAGPLLQVNQAMCEFFGYDAETLLTKTWIELTAPEYRDADLANVADMMAGRIDSYQMDKEFIHADGHRIWGHLAVGCLRNSDGSVATSIGQIVDITAEVEARQSVERYRKLMENSNVGMSLNTAEGKFSDVNQAMCDLFGMDRPTLLDRTWQDLTPENYLQADLRNVEQMLAGRMDTYRVTKEFLRANGDRFWADVSASTIRKPDGAVEYFVAQIVDITERVRTQKRLQSDLDSAAGYVRSILPDELSGPVQVSSRYLPTRELGGDCYNYDWIDDDHLAICLLDVSGHGVEAAMVSVSALDALRSGTLPAETLISPESVLAELNQRFSMEAHSDHYLTIFYGVYEKSTRTLTYAGAGHPPALVLAGPRSRQLPSQAPPLGMFGDTDFTSHTYRMPAGSQLLLYSDGAFEFPLAGGGELSVAGFAELCRKASAGPGLALDAVVETLQSLSATGEFDDDCSLVLLSVD